MKWRFRVWYSDEMFECDFIAKFSAVPRSLLQPKSVYFASSEEELESEPVTEYSNSLRFNCSDDVYLIGLRFIARNQSLSASDLELVEESCPAYELRFRLWPNCSDGSFAHKREESSTFFTRAFNGSEIKIKYLHTNKHRFYISYLNLYLFIIFHSNQKF